MIEVHLRKLQARDPLSAEEVRVIEGLIGQIVDWPSDRTVIRHNEELHQSVLLLEGWMARAKDLPGGQRQIAEIHVAGDFTDLHGFTLKRLDHDVITITRCKVALVPHERLKALTEQHPRLTRMYWFATNLDAAIHREWTLSLGRRTALSRMAHLFCELQIRLGIVGLADESGYDFPLTQVELGECLGLTAVHVNRTLQELRRMRVIELEGRHLSIADLAALRSVADFDDSYLYLEKRER